MGKYATLGPTAYKLYKEGSTLEEIAQFTGVSVTTLSGWSQKYDWPKKRELAQQRAGSIHEIIAAKFHEGLQEMSVPEMMGVNGADALAKLASALSRLGGIDDFPSMAVTVLDDFSKWVSACDKSEEEKEILMDAIQEYFSFIKDRAYPRRG
jgi:transcriptional regulator with XRE-family HTH domain